MTAACHFRCFNDASILAWARAGEQDQAAAFGDAGDDAAGAAKVGGSNIEGDDVDTLANSEDVAAVHGIP